MDKDIGMTEMDLAGGDTDIDRAIETISSGNPVVNRRPSHLVSVYNENTHSFGPNFFFNSLLPQFPTSCLPGSILCSQHVSILLEPEPVFVTK